MPYEEIVNETDTEKTGCGNSSITRYELKDRTTYSNGVAYKIALSKGIRPPMQPYNAQHVKVTSPKGILKIGRPAGKPPQDDPVYGTVFACFGHPVSIDDSDAELRALAKATRRYYGNLGATDIEGLVMLGELPKTVELVATTAKRIAVSFNSLKKLDVVGAFNALSMSNNNHLRRLQRSAMRPQNKDNPLGFASKSWLEMKYGWTPLLSDVDNSAKALARSWEDGGDHIKVYASATESIVGTPNPPPLVTMTGAGSGTSTVRITGYYRVTNAALRLGQGLGVLNPLSLAWELLPYSFVVDWFVPIGAFINSLTAGAGLETIETCTSYKKKYTRRCFVTGFDGYTSFMTYESSIKSYRRVLGLPSPESMFHAPFLGKIKSVDKAVTSLALLNSAFGRR